MTSLNPPPIPQAGASVRMVTVRRNDFMTTAKALQQGDRVRQNKEPPLTPMTISPDDRSHTSRLIPSSGFRSLRLEAISKRLGTGQAEIALIRFIKEPSTVCCPSTRITDEKF